MKARSMLALIPHPSPRMTSIALSFGILASAMGCTQPDRFYAAGGGAPKPSFAPIVQEVMPAVVNVSAVQRVSKAAVDREGTQAGRVEDRVALSGIPPSVVDELLRRFLDGRRHKGEPDPKVASVALGSGFIIDPTGYVVTDDHVVENAEAVTVVAQDASEYPARIVGRDPLTDLALLKIDGAPPLPQVRWGDSDAARVGDWVVAIGSPFGLDNTVSSGIISGRGRDIHAGPYDDFLQIDASMNRGNSGGPTFDLEGNVIGINTAIYSPNGGSVGIGFAIPANRARPVVEQLKEHGKVARGWLGVQIQPVTAEVARNVGLANPAGALVAKVGAGSPAAAAGFEQGDVILSINGQKIRRMHDLPLVIAETPIGRIALVTVWRRNAALALQPVIAEMPMNPVVAELSQEKSSGRRSAGAVTAPLPVSVSSPAI
ncbi:MAG TPA: trypsin-like peptidase domain-containing protein [Stellaceae bacterium]|nr:trypsin-like peptidase domain-containing protein [Stellaceae bacterium]